MKKPKSSHASSPKRKADILRTALACFTEMGVAGTNISDICGRAGVSVGSLYHHYTSKEQLAAALYIEGIRDYQEGLTAEMSRHESARGGVQGIVRYHLGWVKKHNDWARFLFQERHAEFMGETDDEFRKLNTEFVGKIGGWILKHIGSGELRRMPPDLYACIILGPCQEYSRIYLSGHFMTPMEKAVREISDSVWLAVRAPDSAGSAAT